MKKFKHEIFTGIFVISAVVLFIYLFVKIQTGVHKGDLTVMNEGWTYRLNGESLSFENVSDVSLDIEKGDVFEMEGTLPVETFYSPTLYFYTGYSTVNVFIDGIEFYSYGQNFLETTGFAPRGYLTVSLPHGYEGKSILIRFTAGEDMAFASVVPPAIGSLDGIVRYRLNDVKIPISVGLFLLILGFVMTLIAFFNYLFYSEKPKSIYGGFLTLNIAVVTLTYTDSSFLIVDDIFVTTLAEIIAQLFLLTTISGFVRTFPVGRKSHMFFTFVYRASFVSLFLALFLQLRGILPLSAYLIYYQRVMALLAVLMFIPVLSVSVNAFTYHIDKSKLGGGYEMSDIANNLMYLSFLVLVFFMIFESSMSQIFKFILGSDMPFRYVMFIIGVAAFSVLIFFSYFLNDIAILRDRSHMDRLEKMAYSDALTGLYNRAYSDMVIEKLLNANMPFAVIMMDVNRLKNVNDEGGHDLGDEYLRTFSRILMEKFRKSDKLCRTGGDEFVIIMNKATRAVCENRISEFNRYLDAINEKNEYPFKFSAAIGFALSDELAGKNPEEVYSAADKRMYENKQEMHGESTR